MRHQMKQAKFTEEKNRTENSVRKRRKLMFSLNNVHLTPTVLDTGNDSEQTDASVFLAEFTFHLRETNNKQINRKCIKRH